MFTRGVYTSLVVVFAVVSTFALVGSFACVASVDAGSQSVTDLSVAASSTTPTAKPRTRISRIRPSADVRNGFKDDGGRWCEYREVKMYDQYHGENFYVSDKVCF